MTILVTSIHTVIVPVHHFIVTGPGKTSEIYVSIFEGLMHAFFDIGYPEFSPWAIDHI